MSKNRIKSMMFAFAALVISFSVNAQQTCNATKYSAHYGDVTCGIQCDTTGVTQGDTGINVTWTITTTCQDTNPYNGHYVDPATTPYANSFPSANMAAWQSSSGNIVTYTYSKATDDSDIVYGDANSVMVNLYAIPEKYPLCFGYGQYYIDTFAYAYTTSTVPGTSSITHHTAMLTNGIDGEGKLVLPWITFNHAIRSKEVTVSVDTFWTDIEGMLVPGGVTLTLDTSYNWSDTSLYLTVFSISYVNSQSVIGGKTINTFSKVVTYSEPVQSSTAARLSAPANMRTQSHTNVTAHNGEMTIRSNANLSGGVIDLYDMRGEKAGALTIGHSAVEGEARITVHGLTATAYLYTLKDARSIVIGRGLIFYQ